MRAGCAFSTRSACWSHRCSWHWSLLLLQPMLAEQPGLQNAGYCAGANSSSKVANVQPGVEDLQKCLTLTFLWSVIAVNNLGISRVFKHQGLQHGISLSPALVITPKDSESGELHGVFFCLFLLFSPFYLGTFSHLCGCPVKQQYLSVPP